MSKTAVCAMIVASLFVGTPNQLNAESEQDACSEAQGSREIEDCLVELNATVFREVMVRGNTAVLDEISFPEMILVVPGGIERHDPAEGQPGLPKVEELDVRHESFLIKNETAVLAGTLELKGIMDGRPMPARVRYLSVFVSSDDGWRLLARSLVPLIKPGGRS